MKLEHLLNHTVQTIPPSGIRKFFDIASEMDDAISLGVETGKVHVFDKQTEKRLNP